MKKIFFLVLSVFTLVSGMAQAEGIKLVCSLSSAADIYLRSQKAVVVGDKLYYKYPSGKLVLDEGFGCSLEDNGTRIACVGQLIDLSINLKTGFANVDEHQPAGAGILRSFPTICKNQ